MEALAWVIITACSYSLDKLPLWRNHMFKKVKEFFFETERRKRLNDLQKKVEDLQTRYAREKTAVTTAERMVLSAKLTTDNFGMHVLDTDLGQTFYWVAPGEWSIVSQQTPEQSSSLEKDFPDEPVPGSNVIEVRKQRQPRDEQTQESTNPPSQTKSNVTLHSNNTSENKGPTGRRKIILNKVSTASLPFEHASLNYFNIERNKEKNVVRISAATPGSGFTSCKVLVRNEREFQDLVEHYKSIDSKLKEFKIFADKIQATELYVKE
jgi:hypothetical protein